MESNSPKRHGCLLTFLLLSLLANAGSVLSYTLFQDKMISLQPTIPSWAYYVLSVAALINIFFVVMIFQWKKMGFYGFISISILACILNFFLSLGIVGSLSGLIGIGILYWVLQMGGENKAWNYLK